MPLKLETFFDEFGYLADAPNGVAKLRELILQLAVQGKLVPQDANDEPAAVLLAKIKAEKERLVQEKKIKKSDPLPPIEADEIPFDLPQGWEWARFGTITINRDGERIPLEKSARAIRQGQYDYYGASGVIDKIDDFIFDKSLLLIGEDGANLVNRSTPIAFIAHGKYWVNNHAHVLDGISLEFLRYLELFINSIDLKPYVTGTAQPKMNQAKMNSIVVAVPPANEQERIFSKVDQLMALCDELEARQQRQQSARVKLNNAALEGLLTARTPTAFTEHWQRICDNFDLLYDAPATVTALRQAILQLAVQGKLVPQDAHDEPASVLLAKIKAEKERLMQEKKIKKSDSLPPIELDEVPFDLPQGWEWTRTGELARLIEYGTSEKASPQNIGVPVLRMNNIEAGKVRLSNLKYLPANLEELPKLYLKNNDLLFNRTNSFELVGKTGVFKGQDDSFTFASYLIRVRLFDDYLNPDFVNLAMNAGFFRKTQIEPEITQQCGQANFNGTKLANTAIPLPPLAEQRRIVAKVDQLMTLCDDLEAKLRQAQTASAKLMTATVQHLAAA